MTPPELFYSEPVYRPPSEGKKSLLLTATIGCSFKCTYCYPYKDKKFAIRDVFDIKKDIETAKILYKNQIERIFLLDGNAFVMKPADLIEISEYGYKIHPNLQRISAYAHAKDINRKSDEDLRKIAQSGLNMVYVGIETGDDILLDRIKKRTNAEELAKAAQKCHRAGIVFSGTIILGLAGSNEQESRRHAIKTAELINHMNPLSPTTWYISALTLMIPPGTPIEQEVLSHKLHPMSNLQILEELRMIIENISDDLNGCIFRANHASNYLPLKGILSKDKQKLLTTIDQGIKNPQSLKPEYFRGL
ncbi:radical SAM protein [Candidatus Lokiarchaeum ossiferum]|uniref:radical SAM protein n=1 Tax=Candidatus Lokiarchaeum ossiferum TaxID=2951803 RepID=UPI00352C1855